MTDDELRTSCDRLRLAACDPGGPLYGSNLVPLIDDVTAALLGRLGPADDGMAVDEAFLVGLGFVRYAGGLSLGIAIGSGRLFVVRQIGGPPHWCWRDGEGDAAFLPGLPTRGAVRAMLRALNVPPPEARHAPR